MEWRRTKPEQQSTTEAPESEKQQNRTTNQKKNGMRMSQKNLCGQPKTCIIQLTKTNPDPQPTTTANETKKTTN